MADNARKKLQFNFRKKFKQTQINKSIPQHYQWKEKIILAHQR